MQILKAAILYFGPRLRSRFVLGTIRVLLVRPPHRHQKGGIDRDAGDDRGELAHGPVDDPASSRPAQGNRANCDRPRRACSFGRRGIHVRALASGSDNRRISFQPRSCGRNCIHHRTRRLRCDAASRSPSRMRPSKGFSNVLAGNQSLIGIFWIFLAICPSCDQMPRLVVQFRKK